MEVFMWCVLLLGLVFYAEIAANQETFAEMTLYDPTDLMIHSKKRPHLVLTMRNLGKTDSFSVHFVDPCNVYKEVKIEKFQIAEGKDVEIFILSRNPELSKVEDPCEFSVVLTRTSDKVFMAKTFRFPILSMTSTTTPQSRGTTLVVQSTTDCPVVELKGVNSTLPSCGASDGVITCGVFSSMLLGSAILLPAITNHILFRGLNSG